MASLSDTRTTGISAQLVFTEQALACVPPLVVEALRNADLRINIPEQLENDVPVSEVSGNLIRKDTTGAIYAPATRIVELGSAQVTITTTTAPGVPTALSFDASSVTDLTTAIKDIDFSFQPPGALVRNQPPRIQGTAIVVDFYRLNGSPGPPYEEVIITGTGRLLVVPAPAIP